MIQKRMLHLSVLSYAYFLLDLDLRFFVWVIALLGLEIILFAEVFLAVLLRVLIWSQKGEHRICKHLSVFIGNAYCRNIWNALESYAVAGKANLSRMKTFQNWIWKTSKMPNYLIFSAIGATYVLYWIWNNSGDCS